MTASRFFVSALAVALAVGVFSACSHEPSGPVATTLQVVLSSPSSDDGALLFTLTGGRVDSLDADGLTVYTNRPDATTLQVILTGQLESGTIARIHIADGRLAPQYSATVNQAAARASYVQREPATYRVALEP